MLCIQDFIPPLQLSFTPAVFPGYQLAAVIVQNNRQISLFSRKLNNKHWWCAITEKELLDNIKTYREFKGFLLRYKVILHTDNKHLVKDDPVLNRDQVIKWQILLEGFRPEIVLTAGMTNAGDDTIRRPDMNPTYTVLRVS